MTHRKGKAVYLTAEKPQQCDLCGKIAELRPYGPNGECVCFECGMKDHEAAVRQFVQKVLNAKSQGGRTDDE